MPYTAGATQVVTGAYDADGVFFPLDSLPQKINRDASGNTTSIVATGTYHIYTQTFNYVNGVVDNITAWVKAPKP